MTVSRSFMDFAKCKGTKHPNFFFPEGPIGVKEAVKFCSNCPVKLNCLMYAIENDIQFGVWGAKSTYARRRIQLNHNSQYN